MKLRIVHKGLIYLCFPLLLQAVFFFQMFKLMGETEQSIKRQSAHIAMARELDFLVLSFAYALGAIRMHTYKNFPSSLQYRKTMQEHLDTMTELSSNAGSEYKQVLASCKQLIAAQCKVLELLQNAKDGNDELIGESAAVRLFIIRGDALGPVVARSWDKELRLLEEERLKEAEARGKIKNLIVVSSLASMALTLLFICLFIKDITQRLNVLVTNARLLGHEAALPRMVSGSDEIAFLNQVMHEAHVNQIESANYRRSVREMLAHDLRNPTMAVALAFDVMLKTAETDTVLAPKTKIQSMMQSLKQAAMLLDNLLSLDRMEVSDLQLNLSMVPAKDLIRDTLDLAKVQTAQKKISILCEVENINIVCDRMRMVQVLANLVGNAARYSPVHSKIELQVSREPGQARFFVRDNGYGMDADVQKKVFEKYFQVRSKESGAGYGLGLAICQQIVVRHKGEIGVDSAPGKGATFWFTLPVDEVEEDD